MSIAFYLNLCRTIFTEYQGLVKYWLTFNEINMLQNGGGPSIYPYTCAPADVLGTQQKLQRDTWLCSDVQVRGYYPGYVLRFFRDSRIDEQRRGPGLESPACSQRRGPER